MNTSPVLQILAGVLHLGVLICLSDAQALESKTQLSSASSAYESLLREWSNFWGNQYKFIDTTDETQDLEMLLESCNRSSAVLAILGGAPPIRRNPSIRQPFLEIVGEEDNAVSPRSLSLDLHLNSSHEVALSSILGIEALNKGIQSIEGALGRPLHAFRIVPIPFPDSKPECKRLFALWNVSSGTILLDQRVLHAMTPHLDQIGRIADVFAGSLTANTATFISRNLADNFKGGLMSQLVRYVLPGALLAAVGSQIPLWFCIACPVVLGLLAPFIFNAGLGAAAEAICTHYSLPTSECNDLWYGAFAVAMLLSLASAIPIVFICQIPKCGRSGIV